MSDEDDGGVVIVDDGPQAWSREQYEVVRVRVGRFLPRGRSPRELPGFDVAVIRTAAPDAGGAPRP